ncbi:MAG: hypothetical protein HY039_11710 [Nitrospirae bacterium]|nr:hypothetical protein [Nitrospirota bacterium]
MTQTDKSTNRIAWILGGVALLSFAFGVFMFLPAEHRARKIQEMDKKYQAKQERRAQSWSNSSSR